MSIAESFIEPLAPEDYIDWDEGRDFPEAEEEECEPECTCEQYDGFWVDSSGCELHNPESDYNRARYLQCEKCSARNETVGDRYCVSRDEDTSQSWLEVNRRVRVIVCRGCHDEMVRKGDARRGVGGPELVEVTF